MIPKVIHYIWFGGKPLPKLTLKCIESWKKYLPDYEIKRWDESNFDINMIPFTQEAAAAQKWAFVSDYARFWILYHYGGVYLDTDVELVKPMDKILYRGGFMGIECDDPKIGVSVNPGLGIGVEAGNPLTQFLVKRYESIHFYPELLGIKKQTVILHTMDYLKMRGFENENKLQCVDNIWIYPKEYFCPTLLGLKITENTYSIHHYDGSWQDHKTRYKWRLYKLLVLDNFIGTRIYSWLKNKIKK